MRDNVLWRKEACIIALLASELGVSTERAIDIFYGSHVYQLLSGVQSGLRLMSDGYIVEDVLAELRSKSS